MKTVIDAAIIKNERILLVRKQKTWILPGGKPKEGESDIECLVREVSKEELPGTRIKVGNYYNSFEGMTPHSNTEMNAKVYFAVLINGVCKPSAEINKAAWTKNPESYNLSDITSKVIKDLRQDNYL